MGPKRTVRAPTISVVVPTFGRVGSLALCLEALCAQNLTNAYEVIVCDDGSSEPVAPAVAHFADRLALTVVRQRHAGPAAARNTGARRARGRFLAFTDDDCVPEPDWLARLVEQFAHRPGHLIGGALVNLLPRDPYASTTQLIMSSVYAYYERNPSRQRFFSTTNLAVPARRFWEIDGFSESFPRAAGEDYDFCARWHESGFPSAYAPVARVGHAHGHDLRSFLRQHFGYGRALLRVRQGMARRNGRVGIQMESPNFYRQLLTAPLDRRFGLHSLQYALLMLASQAATAAGAAAEFFTPEMEQRERPMTAELRAPRTSSAAR
ncbi:MAG: glycosyltransferase [Gemmatimonadaceae bacterium]